MDGPLCLSAHECTHCSVYEFPYLETGIIYTEKQQQPQAGTPLCTPTWVSFDTLGNYEGKLAWHSHCISNPILKPGS